MIQLKVEHDGQNMVEMALILPVLIFLLLIIMEGGRIFAAYVELQYIAREGARFASMNCTSMAVRDDQLDNWVVSILEPHLMRRLSNLNPADLSVGFARNTDGTEIWVTLDISYPLRVNAPIIRDIAGTTINLQSKTVMRSE